MALFSHSKFDAHELVVSVAEKVSGLRAIIAVHNTALGAAIGGCRMWPYASDDEALADVLRLSKGMSYKNALANLPNGGGKAVIIGDPRKDKTPALLRAFGRAVDLIGGCYYTAEDSGTSVEDMEIIGSETAYVAGRTTGHAASGDPSGYTALGVFLGLKEALRAKTGIASVAGRRIAISGLGNVGSRLAEMLHKEGAALTVADIDAEKVRQAVAAWGARATSVDKIHAAEVDVYAPCALGGAINGQTIGGLNASIIAGGANNQLDDPEYGAVLWRRKILYAPDFVINAGGVINVGAEVGGTYDPAAVKRKVEAIPETLRKVFDRAAGENRPTSVIAEEMARERIAAAEVLKAAA